MTMNNREARKEQVYRLLGTSTYTQQDVAEKLQISKTTVSLYTTELVRAGRLVEISPFPNDTGSTKRYSSIKMVNLEPGSSIHMDCDHLMEQFLDFVRRHFPAGGYDNERELTMRVERLVRAYAFFPLEPDEAERVANAERVREYSAEVISDVTDLLMLLKAFAAIDLRSRAIHPILRTSEAKDFARIISERVDSGINLATQPPEE